MLVKSQVKYIQSLGHKKFRDAAGVFVAEGSKIVQELLSYPPVSLAELYATREWLLENENRFPAAKNKVAVEAHELERISFLSTPGQVLAVFRKPVFSDITKQPGITLLLDEIQDPGNLGTIIRTADWFGVRRIICSPGTADAFNPKVVQATMGSIARVEVLYGDLKEYMAGHPGIPSYAATLDGEDLVHMLRVPEALILIGNESRGIHKSLASLASHRIRIPRKGAAESLNAAVAAGIVLSLIQKD
ncbi:MAG: RNA methyltransferase [Bacteroidota bacterium]|nr:RNA methyltransferase [Bacteroidota bacterium]MDP4212097.1 RNA methyltransferase [Bacteroidota bacterium]MDP4249288.1 RNA methyltransferase [Bacteroidota bacterium]